MQQAAHLAPMTFSVRANNAATSLTEAMVIATNGNVGIGTTAPSAKLEILGSIGVNDPIMLVGTTGNSDANSLQLKNGSGNINLFVAGGSGNFMPNTAQGDVGIRTSIGKKFFIGDSAASKVVIDSVGNVGIGTAIPSAALSLHIPNSANPLMSFTRGDVTNAVWNIQESQSILGLNGSGAFSLYNAGTAAYDIGMRGATSGSAQFMLQGSSGNVGIGTTAPSEKLGINGKLNLLSDGTGVTENSSFNFEVTQDEVNTNKSALYIYGKDFSYERIFFGKSGKPVYSLNFANVSILESVPPFRTSDNMNYGVDDSHGIRRSNDNVQFVSSSPTGGHFQWFTKNTYSNYGGSTERMRLDVNGNLGIGTTTPGYKLQVGIAADGSEARANAWNTLSDERLKKDFELIPDSLEKLLSLNGYYYYWNRGTDHSKKLGLKAQEVEEVFPEVVSKGRDGYLSVSYNHLVGAVISAIKEFFNKWTADSEAIHKELALKANKEELIKLREENAKLKDRLDKIEKYLKK